MYFKLGYTFLIYCSYTYSHIPCVVLAVKPTLSTAEVDRVVLRRFTHPTLIKYVPTRIITIGITLPSTALLDMSSFNILGKKMVRKAA